MRDLATLVQTAGKQGKEGNIQWHIVFNTIFLEKLKNIGADSFKAIYDLQNGTIIKKQKDRSVIRFDIGGSIFFLKRHEREKQQKGGIIESSLFSWCSEGGKEFANFCTFRLHGLATATPIAMGEKMFDDGTVESFLLTEDFSPYVQLEYLIRNKPESLVGSENSEKRKNILQAVARYAVKMHKQGFNHQDFNATHVLLAGLDTNEPALALFDLQRVDQNRLQKFRWPIKALAEFNYSSRENSVFSNEERLFLFRAYKKNLGKQPSFFDHLQWKWIEAKTNRIARHTAKRHARHRR